MRLRIVLCATLIALSASVAHAEEYLNFDEVPSCVFGEDANTIRPQLLNVHPQLLEVNNVPQAGRIVRQRRQSAFVRR